MPIVVKTIGIFMICMGTLATFSPELIRKAVSFFKEGKMMYLAAGARAAVGLLIIVASFYCAIQAMVLPVGIIIFLAGSVGFLVGVARLQAVADWLLAKSDNVLRAWLVIVFVMGALLIYGA